VSLFKKTGRGLALTAEGRRLWKDLQPILNQLERLELKYRHKAETTAQEILAIGGSPGLSTVLLPSLVARFKEDHPSITVFLHTATSEEIQELVLNGKIELALVVNPFPSLGLHIEPYRREQLVPFVSPKHPLTKQQGLPLKELVKFPLAVRMGRSRENRAAAYLARIQGGYSKPTILSAVIRLRQSRPLSEREPR
jgi:DNA-binding transcriptional LysR family regulator